MKHPIIILFAVIFGGFTTMLAAEDKPTATQTASDVALKQAELKIVPLKPASTAKVEVGVIEPVADLKVEPSPSDSSPKTTNTADIAAEQLVSAFTDTLTSAPAEAEAEAEVEVEVEAEVEADAVSAVVSLEQQSVSLDEVNTNSAIPTDRIRAVISQQEQAWNSGDIDAYMQGYWQSDNLRFVSNGKFSYGWDVILASYKKSYPDSARMGKLSFNVKEIKMLSNYAALVVGRWQLERTKDKPNGVFTLLIERIDDKWVITHDHSSD